jgi:hypothetical protein
MCEEEEVERGRRRGNVLGGRGGKGEEGGGMCEEEEWEREGC